MDSLQYGVVILALLGVAVYAGWNAYGLFRATRKAKKRQQ